MFHVAPSHAPRRALAALTLGAIGWLTACGESDGPEPVAPPRFSVTLLDPAPGEPMSLAVLPDGRVLHATRDGDVFLHDGAGTRTIAAQIPVYTHDEEGLQSLAIDPAFGENGWVYLYYSPPLDTLSDNPDTTLDEGAAPASGDAASWAPFAGYLQLSRMRFDGSNLDLTSEQRLLQVPVERGICCHIGGDIDFDGAGNLLLSTGDDTNPFASDGYAPLDERLDRNPAYDAQRSAGNTNDLRGKLLRIHVEDDGTYSIPEGNLFARDMPQTRPEIYVMGLRNPFRFAADRQRGVVYLADYAPDAPGASAARGPAGTGKWAIVRGAANYGWPYCATAELPYVDYDFATSASGEPFDCAAPVNRSPRNTGLERLPPVTEPEVYYSYTASDPFAALGAGGIGPMAGPAPAFDPSSPLPGRWPSDLSGSPLFYEWVRDFVAIMRLRDDASFERIDRVGGLRVDNPIDMEFAPDGALIVLNYGDGFNSANSDASLARIEANAPATADP
jgi:glucose/arabinose dehydrogenase